MSHADPLAALQRRANRHALEDGVADILAGVYAITAGSATQRPSLLALAVVYLGLYAMAWKFFHHQVSARRTGFAEVAHPPHLAVLTGILASAVVSLAVVAAATFSAGRLWDLGSWPAWSPVIAGLALAGGFLHAGMSTGLWRWAAYAAAAFAGALFFWLYPFGPVINPSDRLTLLLFSVGGLLILAGIAVLIRFTRTHPIVAEAGHDA